MPRPRCAEFRAGRRRPRLRRLRLQRGRLTDCLLRRGDEGLRDRHRLRRWPGRSQRPARRGHGADQRAARQPPLEEPVRLVVMDMGWTPQRLCVPADLKWLRGRGRIVSLVKPTTRVEAAELAPAQTRRAGRARKQASFSVLEQFETWVRGRELDQSPFARGRQDAPTATPSTSCCSNRSAPGNRDPGADNCRVATQTHFFAGAPSRVRCSARAGRWDTRRTQAVLRDSPLHAGALGAGDRRPHRARGSIRYRVLKLFVEPDRVARQTRQTGCDTGWYVQPALRERGASARNCSIVQRSTGPCP